MVLLTQGELLFYSGIGIAGINGAVLVIELIVYTVKKRRLRDRLIDRYGF